MRTTALEPFGTEVTGIDLGASTGEWNDTIAELIASSRVVVFRNQEIDDTQFIRFLERLGSLMFTEGETPVADAPALNVVSNVGRSTPPRSVFHSDTSYVARPPAYTALRPVLLPPSGGATVFTDQVAVARNLPARYHRLLQGRTVRHQASGVPMLDEGTRHPLLRRHPITGEVALYLSTPERCTELSGADKHTSARVIGALYRRSIRRSTLYRHHWRHGDLVIWDNRVTMHRADHDGVNGDRVLHRGMVRGERPIPA